MNFENQLQQWVQIDNQLKTFSEKIINLRKQRNTLSENITKYAISNNLYGKKINISNERIQISNTKLAEPLTFKYLEKTLSEIIQNESQVKIIIDKLKQKRNIKVIPEIKRFSDN
jgi:type II secretory pathway component PulM